MFETAPGCSVGSAMKNYINQAPKKKETTSQIIPGHAVTIRALAM